jgi:hypothetical protein
VSELSSSPPEVARFSRRLQIHEDPAVIEKLQEYALDSGRSVAAEVRAALRWWIRGHDEEDD